MIGLPKALGWMFRLCAVSPSGTNTDKYFSLSVLCFTAYSTWVLMPPVYEQYFNAEKTFINISVVLMLLANVVFTIINWIKPENYLSMMKDLESIANKMVNMSDENPKERIIWLILTAFFMTSVTFLYNCSFHYNTLLLVINLILNAPLLQHMIIVENIRIMFSQVNNMLIGIASSKNPGTVVTHLDPLFRVHSDLQALVVDVDIHFCFYILLNYTAKFLQITLVMYRYLNDIETDNENVEYEFIVAITRELLYLVMQAVVCHVCSKEANRTVLLAHRVLHLETQQNLWEEVDLFSTLAVVNKVHFTVGGVFTLDRALITQTVTTALAYLIIAVQMREVRLFGNES